MYQRWSNEELLAEFMLAHESGKPVTLDLMDVDSREIEGPTPATGVYGHSVNVVSVVERGDGIEVVIDFPETATYSEFLHKAIELPFRVSIQLQRMQSRGPLVQWDSAPPRFDVVGGPEQVESESGPKLRVVLRSE